MATSEKTDELNEHIEMRDSSIDKPKAIDNAQQAFHDEFEFKDEEWKAQYTKKLIWKVDLHLLPFLVIMYTLNFLDRSNLAQARQGSLEKDLNMKGTDFNLATSILFVGYLLMQLPSNVLITRVRPSFYLSAAMMCWGVVSTCNAATHNFTSLIVVRFFLGFVEAPFCMSSIEPRLSTFTGPMLTKSSPGSNFPHEFVVHAC